MLTRSLLAGVACALLGACTGPDFRGVVLEPPEPAPALALADSNGTVLDLAGERGKVVLVFFGYTHCPDICPTTLADWRKAKGLLGDEARAVRWLFVTVDPERDTPQLAHRYAARFDRDFRGLSGTPDQVRAAMAAWKIGSVRDAGGTDSSYTVSHPSVVFVLDREGRVRLLHRQGMPPSAIAADIRALL
ncbi:MAG: SCO family protein [Gemmatimonadaceae bacterium]|nr:SCO family protein [Gemmatimonadaceae bacterium]